MNYCSNSGDRLSKWDVYGIRELFGVKPPLALATPGGLCLDVPSGNTTNGQVLQSFACHDPSVLGNQEWSYDLASKTIRQAGKCLDSYQSASLYIDTCYGDAFQQVFLSGMELRGFGDQCLVPVGNVTSTPGVELTLNPCVSSLYDNPIATFQSWTYDAPSRELQDGSGLCLQVSGSDLVVEPCSSTVTSQRWTLSGGQIESDVGGCVDQDPTTERMFLNSSCEAVEASERFHFAGWIKLNNQCLQLSGPSQNGTHIGLGACDSRRNDQMFDWYF
jgi:hypothetical protein